MKRAIVCVGQPEIRRSRAGGARCSAERRPARPAGHRLPSHRRQQAHCRRGRQSRTQRFVFLVGRSLFVSIEKKPSVALTLFVLLLVWKYSPWLVTDRLWKPGRSGPWKIFTQNNKYHWRPTFLPYCGPYRKFLGCWNDCLECKTHWAKDHNDGRNIRKFISAVNFNLRPILFVYLKSLDDSTSKVWIWNESWMETWVSFFYQNPFTCTDFYVAGSPPPVAFVSPGDMSPTPMKPHPERIVRKCMISFWSRVALRHQSKKAAGSKINVTLILFRQNDYHKKLMTMELIGSPIENVHEVSLFLSIQSQRLSARGRRAPASERGRRRRQPRRRRRLPRHRPSAQSGTWASDRRASRTTSCTRCVLLVFFYWTKPISTENTRLARDRRGPFEHFFLDETLRPKLPSVASKFQASTNDLLAKI